MDSVSKRDRAELALAQACFAAFDTRLFLDTHPENADALAYFYKKKAACKEEKEKYIKEYGPVCAGDDMSMTAWQWVDEPWPWQEEG